MEKETKKVSKKVEETEKETKEVSKKVEEIEKKSSDDEKMAALEAEIAELKKEKEKSLFQRVMNIVLWTVLIIWMIICLIDFYNVHAEKNPIFCLSKTTNKYSDGNVEMCTGLGYKVIKYNRKSFKALEFGPFWSKDRTEKEETSEKNDDKKTTKKTTTTAKNTKKTTKKSKK